MNVKLLEQVAAMIEKYSENFYMGAWTIGTLVADKQVAPDCKTTGCIAGWAIAIVDGAADGQQYDTFAFREKATDYLHLSDAQAERLFYLDCWPDRFTEDYARAPKRGQIAAERIRHFIATNGAE
jgi:hypothetical protein